MNAKEWLTVEVNKPKYALLTPAQIAAYLNAPTLTEIPGEGYIVSPLDVAEVMNLISAEEWGAISSPSAKWKAAAAADYEAARVVDVAIIEAKGTSNVPLEVAATIVIESQDVRIGQAFITVLAKAGIISPESAAALQTAMNKPAPSTWEPGYSIAQEVLGPTAFVQVSDVEDALSGK